jgi:cell wall-associated NlpC family hydrolase
MTRSVREERANSPGRRVAWLNDGFTPATQVRTFPVTRGLTTRSIKRRSDPELEARLASMRAWLGTSPSSSPPRAPSSRPRARVGAWYGTSDTVPDRSITGDAEGAASDGAPSPTDDEGVPSDAAPSVSSYGPGTRRAVRAPGLGGWSSGPAELSRAVRHRGALIRDALTARGIRYRWGGASRGGFDCSGFTRYLMARHLGIKLPHSAHAQAHYGQKVALGGLKEGDLVFFRTYRRGISHVGVYLGDNRFIHAPHTGRSVSVEPLTGYYRRRFVTARRLTGTGPPG